MVLDILQFVFSSFWTWAGTVILISVPTIGLGTVLGSFTGSR